MLPLDLLVCTHTIFQSIVRLYMSFKHRRRVRMGCLYILRLGPGNPADDPAFMSCNAEEHIGIREAMVQKPNFGVQAILICD